MVKVVDKYQKLKDGLKKKDDKALNQTRHLLEKASYDYYNTGKTIMEDIDYDNLYIAYINAGGDEIVGSPAPSGKKLVNVQHNFNELVGTLAKTHGIDELEEWFIKVFSKLKGKMKTLSIGLSFKFDGNSVVIEYKNGKPIKALTRGKDGKGADMLEVFKRHRIKSKEDVAIKYEVIIKWDDFRQLKIDEGKYYKNPRNLVAGKLGSNDAPKYYPYMTLVPLWVKLKDKIMKREDQLDFIEDNFGEDVELFHLYNLYSDININKNNITELSKEINDVYDLYTEERYTLPYMIDGLVIEIMDQEARDILGYTNEKKDIPNWAVALKFPFMEHESTVTGFDFTLGDSGRITPRVFFEPVEFIGTIHTKQSLENYARFHELNLGIGSKILVSYHNDCLTYITKIDCKENDNIKPYPFTNICPICGKHSVVLNKNKAFAFCSNKECEANIIGKIQNFLIKMDIKGIKFNTLKKLYDNKLITDVPSLFSIDYDKVENIEGLGASTALNIAGSLNSPWQYEKPFDYNIIGSLLIDGISTDKAKEISKHYSIGDLLAFYEDGTLQKKIIELEGFSKISANKLYKGIKENKTTINFLIEKGYRNYKDTIKKIEGVDPLKIVFTNFRDAAFQSQLEEIGHKVMTSSVSSKTQLVIAPDVNGTTVKLKKARELGIRIATPEEIKKEYGLE